MQSIGKQASDDQQDPYISVKETADLLKVSSLTVYRRFHAGDFPGRKIGRKIDLHRPFVIDLLGEIRSGRNVDVDAYAAAWRARNAASGAVA